MIFWLIWLINQRAFYSLALSIIVVGIVIGIVIVIVCVQPPPLATGLNIGTLYLE